jgi:hypothetical protein
MKKRSVFAVMMLATLLAPVHFLPAGSTPAEATVPEAAIAQPAQLSSPAASGAIAGGPVVPYVFNGDLRDLPQRQSNGDQSEVIPWRQIPGVELKPAPPGWVDPMVQNEMGAGQMPLPLIDFPGLEGSDAGGWVPPDTNGDVGLTHYVQAVNVGIGMYDKATGTELVNITFNDFFNGTGTLCDYSNRGDPIALYDPMAGRWLISDFGWVGGSGPYYQCIAISQSEDPVSGGWYFYAMLANPLDPNSLNDYPKWGVWPDAYYLSANMFYGLTTGAKVWALDRAAMLNGDPFTYVTFDLGSAYWSLLPGNMRGDLPPAGSPNYFASIGFPDTLRLWKFHVDWNNPGNSTFTGPVELPVADFAMIQDIPQPPPGEWVDSLGDRLMMQLQYRNLDGHEALWVNHTVASGGVAGVRWYEIRDPGGTPVVYQQGTFQPDDEYRWMGSLAVDQDGNMAVGYSVSSTTLYPAIRYAGRLAGEIPGLLPQGEASMIEGNGVQLSGSGRWGDYSAMTIDPVDDCTFWYTQEYYAISSNRNWQTRIGSFRFPSCGLPKGWLTGMVYNTANGEPVASVPVMAESPEVMLTGQTDASGIYSMTLPAGTYTVTAGPLPPGFPFPAVVPGVVVAAGEVTSLDIGLGGNPSLEEGMAWVDDDVPGGNGNGYPEPGESGLLLWETISNTGALTATNIMAELFAVTPGVTVTVSAVDYPDIGPGEAWANLTPFEFSIAPTVPCGSELAFEKVVTADQGVYTLTLTLDAKVPLPITSLFSDDMESGPANWTTGGVNDAWAITEEEAHSPTHAWSDSPYGDYASNKNAWLRSPIFDMSDMTDATLSFWHRYELEEGWDFGYVEYSVDGGTTWIPLNGYSGFEIDWLESQFDVPAFDNQPAVAFRFRIQSDGNTQEDGWYIDDVDLSYHPFECTYPVQAPAVPVLISPPNGLITSTREITFTWQSGDGPVPDGYNLELDGVVITTTDTFSATSLEVGVHDWRVRAFNIVGYSDYSELWSVEISDPPGVPTLLAPPDGLITSTHEITFAWESGAGGAPSGYNVELDGTVYTTTVTSWGTTLDSGDHSWRVRAFNGLGYSAYSDLWSLTIENRLFLPIVLR